MWARELAFHKLRGQRAIEWPLDSPDVKKGTHEKMNERGTKEQAGRPCHSPIPRCVRPSFLRCLRLPAGRRGSHEKVVW